MYLDDLLLAMSRISEYISEHTFDSFKKDYKTVDAVVRNFEIIWDVAFNHLPENKVQIEEMIERELNSRQ
jgi:uncharacterized protein with HEPN domain